MLPADNVAGAQDMQGSSAAEPERSPSTNAGAESGFKLRVCAAYTEVTLTLSTVNSPVP